MQIGHGSGIAAPPREGSGARRRVDDRALAIVWSEAFKLVPLPSPDIMNQDRAWERYLTGATAVAERSVRAFRDAVE